ncbi:ComEC/Rec2 family competence protein [Vibrio sp. M60_M31a]
MARKTANLVCDSQLALSVFVIPISGYFFSGFSLSSIAYNLVFIHRFGFVVVPSNVYRVIYFFIATRILANSLAIDGFLFMAVKESLQYAFGTWQPLSIELTWILFSLCTFLVLKRLLLWRGWLLLCVITPSSFQV